MRLAIEQIPHTEQIVLAGDHTAWSRLEALTLKERTYEHQAITFVRFQTSNIGTRLQFDSLGATDRRELGITVIT
jgi:hypothetical protein